MRSLKYKVILTILIIILIMIFENISYAQNIFDLYDLSFTIGSKNYTINNITKSLSSSPVSQDGEVLAPYKEVFGGLGYIAQYDETRGRIVAKRKTDTIILTIGSTIANINGTVKKSLTASKMVGDNILIPLKFVCESAGATTYWDEKAKTLYIKRWLKYNTGKIMIHDKSSNKDTVYVYDGELFTTISLENKEIKNWYSYKEQVLATIYDKANNNYNLAIFKKDKFEVLIKNFDIKDTVEYNDNLIIHGYDRDQKINKLYRFDGKDLLLIQSDFYVGKYTIFKDKLIINKYNKNRDYALLVFDRNSWNPTVLKDKFIMQTFLENNGLLYMTGVWQSGNDKPLATYDGNSYSNSFKILYDDTNVDLNKITMYNNNLYAIISGNLKIISNNRTTDVLFPYSTGIYIKYNVQAIKLYGTKIYISVSGGQYVDSEGKSTKVPEGIEKITPAVISFSDIGHFYTVVDNFQLKEFRIENNKLLMLGVDKDTQDATLYLYDSSKLQKAIDVFSIKNIISLNDKIFLEIQDKDRITNKDRNTILLCDNNGITNLALGMDAKYWDTVGGQLIFAGLEQDINKNKIYSYGNKFTELLSNFEVKYWKKFSDTLFVNGLDPDANMQSMYKFAGGQKIKLIDNLEISNIIKAKGSYYFVYGIQKDKNSSYCGKKVLFIYDDRTRKFVVMKKDINITDMIFIN